MTSYKDLGWGISLLDTAFQRADMAACYFLQEGDDVVIVETGTKDTVPLMMEYLNQKGIAPEQVKYVAVTHVHLDHAGGAGLLMQSLPNAKLVVHPLGARHMIDPAKLQAGATAVYGEEEFSKTYGDLLPVDKNRVISPAHKETLSLGERVLTFLDTPGHARHHFCVFDGLSESFFTGDTFGLAYQELTNENGPFLFPTTTPVQFDPEALKNSIRLLLDYAPKHMFLTHYGVLDNPSSHGDRLINQVDELVSLAQKVATECEPSSDEYVTLLNQTLMAHFLSNLEKHNCSLSLDEQQAVIKTDVLLNAQGLAVWLS